MRPAALPRNEVVDRLAVVFREAGYEGATLARLSGATGLQRASLYHYFPGGKDDMAHAVLDQLGAVIETTVLEPLKGPGAPAERVARMGAALDAFYAGGKLNCIVGALVLGGAHARFGARVGAALRAWIAALADVVQETGLPRAEAERRAEAAVVAVQGALVVARALGDTGPFERVLAALPDALLGGAAEA